MVASAIPLAVAANVTRLMMIILAGEVFGQSGGEYVHDSSVLSMIPYLVAFLGMFFLAHLFRENRDKKRRRPDPEEPDESEETETEEVARD
jgi:hypothetical protein